MDELGRALLKLERRVRDFDRLRRAVELYLRVDPYRLIYEASTLDRLPPEERRRLLVEVQALLKHIDPGYRGTINPGLEDNLLLLAWLLILFPEPFLSDAMGLGAIGLWALIKKAKGERIDLSTIRYSLKYAMEALKKQ